MSFFQNILASTRNLIGFSFTRPNIGNNSVATLKDVNQVISQLNTAFPYVSYLMVVNQTGTADPVVQIGIDPESNNGTPCPPLHCPCKVINPGQCKSYCCVSADRISAGIYEFTVPEGAGFKIGVTVAQLSNPDHHIRYQRGADSAGNAVYRIKTYIGLVATDALLVDQFIEVKVFKV